MAQEFFQFNSRSSRKRWPNTNRPMRPGSWTKSAAPGPRFNSPRQAVPAISDEYQPGSAKRLAGGILVPARSGIAGILRWVISTSRRRKIYATSVLALIAVIFFVLAPVYERARTELRGKLASVRSTTSSAPLVVTVGERRPLSELVAYLQAAGYSEAASATDRRRGLYRILNSGQIIEVYPSGTETTRRDSVRITFEPDGSAIRTIILISTNESVLRWEIKPLQLASYEVRRAPDGKVNIAAYSYASLDDLRASRMAQAAEEIEDRRFATRWLPVDLRSIARATIRNAEAREVKEGGSTFYQQLARIVFISEEERQQRSLKRKLKELGYAFIIWLELSPDEVRELYFNLVPMGASTDGIELVGLGAAARAYFGKHVANLDAKEVSILTTLIESGRYSPLVTAPKAASARVERSQDVAKSLVDANVFSRKELADIFDKQPEVRPALWPDGMGDYQSLINHELEDISKRVDLRDQEVRITSSLNPSLQTAVNNAIQMDVTGLRQRSGKPLEMAVVMLDIATGECLAIAGRSNTRTASPAHLNLALQAKRPLGSDFKIFVYAAAFETALEGVHSGAQTPSTIVQDAPTIFHYGQIYAPQNYGGHYQMRALTLYDAIAESSNVVAVKETMKVGTRRVSDIAEAAGLDRPDDRFPSIALGASSATLMQITNAYATFARGGIALQPHAISRIESEDGRVLYTTPNGRKQIIDSRVAYLVVRGLAGVFDRPIGTAHRARTQVPELNGVALYGKTGTARDSWFIGMTSRLVCGVWVGHKAYQQSHLTGAQAALKVWADIMATARRARPELFEGQIIMPPGIVEVPIDPSTGLIATANCPETINYPFIRGTEPKEVCNHTGEHLPKDHR